MDYYDEDWAFRSLLADENSYHIEIDAFDVMLSVIGIAAPATALGSCLGLGLRKQVLEAMQKSAEVSIPMELDPKVIILPAVVQLAFPLAMATVVAAIIFVAILFYDLHS